MKRLSRRSLIGGFGAGAVVAIGGCLGDDDGAQSPEETGEPSDWGVAGTDLPPRLERAFAFVYPSADGDIEEVLVERSQSRYGPIHESWFGEPSVSQGIEFDWVIKVDHGTSPLFDGVVGTGTIDPEAAEELTQRGTRQGFEIYDIPGQEAGDDETLGRLATNGEVLLFGPEEWPGEVLDVHAEDVTPFLVSNPAAGAVLEAIDPTQYQVSLSMDVDRTVTVLDRRIEFSTGPELTGVGLKVVDGMLWYALATAYAEPVGETELSRLEEEFAVAFGEDSIELKMAADGRILLAEHAEPIESLDGAEE